MGHVSLALFFFLGRSSQDPLWPDGQKDKNNTSPGRHHTVASLTPASAVTEEPIHKILQRTFESVFAAE